MTTERIDAGWFEDLYRRRPDPWEFETSDYERDKYARTLTALGPPDRRFRRALEAGCANGVFTELLAPRCDRLIAVDASATAVGRAVERLADRGHVEIRRATLPEELPAGPFDLVVCSEILYYWNEALLRAFLTAAEALLAPGGSLLAVHWRPETRTYPLRGDDVHRILADQLSLDHAYGEVAECFLIDRYDRRP